ncbi:MAG: hypothetical protein KDI63_12865, partial [Gammaproteobacteria bacterium]|nr:hypothetical protein [Gammaproteobacteria bacterium]
MKTWISQAGLLWGSVMLATTPVLAGPFDGALASCARSVEFCDELSYDKDLCNSAQKALPDCDQNTGSGVLCKLKLKDIAPTQVSVGAHATQCKAKSKFKRDQKKINKYLLKSAHHVPTVIGP